MKTVVNIDIFPALTFDAGLKFTGVNLELMTDHDMYMFVEDSIRGGVSTISQRHAVANNPMVPESYNPDKPNEWLQYFDANNLVSSSVECVE